ncbi:MAG: hypothetical protein ACYC6A_15650 [Armatimonadota bacterium]
MDPSLMRKLFYRTGIELFTLYVIASLVIVLVQNWRMRAQPRQQRWHLWRVLAAGVVLLVLYLGGAYVVAPRLATQRTWTPYTSAPGKFTVNFPGEPNDFKERLPFAGDYYDLYTFAMPGGWTGVTYTVSYLDAPTQHLEGGPNGALEGMRNMVVSGARSRLLSSSRITFAGRPGIDFTYQNPNGIGIVRARLIMSGQRIYMQWAGPLTDPQTDPNGAEFFKSLQLNEKMMGPSSNK